MNRHLNVREVQDRLEQVRSTVAELSLQARQVETEFRNGQSLEKRRFEAQLTAENGRWEAELALWTSQQQQELEALDRWVQQRRQRLGKAQRGARRSAMERIDLEEGRHKYAVQKGTLEAERRLKEGTEANESRYQEFLARSVPQQEQLALVEHQAAAAMRGFSRFRRALEATPQIEAGPDQDESTLLNRVDEELARARTKLQAFQRNPLPWLFRFLPLWLALLLAALAAGAMVFVPPLLGRPAWGQTQAATAFGIAAAVLVVWYALGWLTSAGAAKRLAEAVARARAWHAHAGHRSVTRHQSEAERLTAEKEETQRQLEDRWHRAIAEARASRDQWPETEAERVSRIQARWETLQTSRRSQRIQAGAERRAALQAAADQRLQPLRADYERKSAQFTQEWNARRESISAARRDRVEPVWRELEAAQRIATSDFPAWSDPTWSGWRPPEQFGNAAPVGSLHLDPVRFCGDLPLDQQWILPATEPKTFPLTLTYPESGSLLLETHKPGAIVATEALNQVVLRLLANTPSGKTNFTIVDPIRLGQNFAGIMHLADFEENLINRRIWTQPAEIEQQLADLTAHMEKVIQMYLRNEYATIAEYNAQAGNIAEKYHYLVVADFPANFSDVALRRLVNIAASGARCGVFTLIHWDRQQPTPPEFVVETLRRNSVVVVQTAQGMALSETPAPGMRIELIPPPLPDRTTEFLHRVGEFGRDAGRVRVPFDQAAPAPADVWSQSSTDELRVPIGRTGATKLQYLALGKGTRQHVLVAGKTGSGKSTLFHVVITNLALWCSPDQVEFYLVDFKKGVEFKCYAEMRLPHARVVAIESDREFGLSVLVRLDEELRRRGDLFRELGVQDLAGHRRVTGGKPLPRALLLIDEFQEFFVEDDRISQTAAVLLDRIVRQGRAFGIHVILGSQTLGGAYTLARTTLGQMVVRIALQCNEADAFLIMDDSNPAPRLLTRPGEGIYNDMAGMLEGNSPFQTVWLEEQERDVRLGEVRARADQAGRQELVPFVFEGNAPAEIRENGELSRILAQTPTQAPAAGRVWLGAPNAIKGPTQVEFLPQSGQHLLLVGQREDAELAILTIALLGLAAQYPAGSARFVWFDSSVPGSKGQEYLAGVWSGLKLPLTLARAGDLAAVLASLSQELRQRADQPDAGTHPIFVILPGLQRFKKLMPEDEFSFGGGASGPVPSDDLKALLSGGPAAGIHLLVSCDNYTNLNRYLGRKALADCGLRVLFQMSANDSSSLIDSPKANLLGLNRALLFHEAEGWLETFRPYSLPDRPWLEQVKAVLASRSVADAGV